jgi:hypothetical protein
MGDLPYGMVAYDSVNVVTNVYLKKQLSNSSLLIQSLALVYSRCTFTDVPRFQLDKSHLPFKGGGKMESFYNCV